MLFCHKITRIFMIYVHLSQKFIVAIYALCPPICLASKVDSAIFSLLECMKEREYKFGKIGVGVKPASKLSAPYISS